MPEKMKINDMARICLLTLRNVFHRGYSWRKRRMFLRL